MLWSSFSDLYLECQGILLIPEDIRQLECITNFKLKDLKKALI